MIAAATEIRPLVEAALDARVRPALAAHGGAVEIDDISPEGVVGVRLLGACVGCPAADYSMQDLVRRGLLGAVEGITDVVLVGSVSDDLLAQALVFLRRNNN
ncbi:MAG: NifU family protein [Propionibacteriaceae bacterium]|nr:NifU family protein [Propionibacteriaceae bacterium]